MDRQEFVDMYEGTFGGSFPVPVKNIVGRDMWWKVVDHIPDDRANEVFEALSSPSTVGRPNLGTLRRCVRSMMPRWRGNRPQEQCALCDGTGWCTVLATRKTRHELSGQDEDEGWQVGVTDRGPLVELAVACKCTKGEQRLTQRTDIDTRRRALAWFHTMLVTCNRTGRSMYEAFEELRAESRGERYDPKDYRGLRHTAEVMAGVPIQASEDNEIPF
jgi:hypothetical protein